VKVFIEDLRSNEVARVLKWLHGQAAEPLHALVDDPAQADLIVICGNWAGEDGSRALTANPLVRRFPERCTVCTDGDIFVPLLPGVYCSPRMGYSTRKGRVQCYSYIARHDKHGNPFVAPLDPNRKRDLLFSFQGGSTSFVRKRLFRIDFGRPDVLVEDTSFHLNWVETADTERQQRRYVETIARSHFVLCPKGIGTGSFRLFEVMRMGAAPVVISDPWVLPEGPDWDSFLIRVREKDIRNLPSILEPYRAESALRGERAKQAWDRWFSTGQEFNQIIARCEAARVAAAPGAKMYRLLWPAMILKPEAWKRIRRPARAMVMGILRVLKLRLPFSVRDESLPRFPGQTNPGESTTGDSSFH
jgi:hypothetical protein